MNLDSSAGLGEYQFCRSGTYVDLERYTVL